MIISIKKYRIIFLGAAIAALSACVPVDRDYVYMDKPGAQHYQRMCASSGPPDVVYFPYHGIFLSAELDDANASIGIHVPAGNFVELEEKSISLGCQAGDVASNTPGNETAVLLPDDSHRQMIEPDEPDYYAYFYAYGSYTSANASVLTGSTRNGYNKYRLADVPVYQGYLYKAKLDGRPLPESGCLNFPRMKINGTSVQGAWVPFHKRHWIGVVQACM